LTSSDENAGLQRASIVAAIAGVFAIGAFLHVPFFNGPEYWPWRWLRRADVTWIAALFAAAAAPALLAQRIHRRGVAVGLIALSAVAMQAAALSLAGTPALERLGIIVRDPASTSYYTAAVQLLDWQGRAPQAAWISKFDQLLRFFPMHARTKPPLPVAFYVELLRLFGAGAPLAAALFIAALSVAAIVAMYVAVRELAGGETAVIGCTLLALMPAPAIFFPQLDVVYALFTICVVATWPRALRGSMGAAAAFGITVFVMSLVSYSLLVLGAFCVVSAAMEAWRSRSPRPVIAAGGVASIVIVGAYALFEVSTGFPAWATFRAALGQQQEILPYLHRPYPLTIPFDLLDFALGVGWAPVAAAIFFLRRSTRADVAVAGLVTPLIVAASGLLQAETARVWIFLMPFVAFAAALEMIHWGRAGRLLVFGSMIVVTIAVYANMRFTYERVFTGSGAFRPIPIHAIR